MAVREAEISTGERGRSTTEQDRSREQDGGKVSPWEWLLAAVGLLLVVGTIGFMLYQAITAGSSPPQIDLQIASIQPIGTGYVVTFTATNHGDTTAADLLIEATLRDDTGPQETSTATITYLPVGSSREGGLYFTQDPRQFQLDLRPKGYEQP